MAEGRKSILGVCEAKSRFSELLKRAESGEEITITRYGAPVAKLVPFRKAIDAEKRAEAIRQIQELGASLSLRGLKIKDLISEKRR